MLRFLTLLLLSASSLLAIEEKFSDKRVDDTENNSEFKLDGVIFAGYERTDTEKNGTPDANGTNARNQGFDVKRAYVNAIGNVIDGPYKGFGFRVTLDGGQVLGGTAATTTASGNNIHVPELKFAYFNVPLYSTSFGTGIIRFGMQNTPVVDAQHGTTNEYFWAHRYIDSATFENLNFASSADMGLSFIHKWEFAGLHLLLGNGEGFRKLNAQNVAAPTTFSTIAANASTVRSNLRTLSQGSGDSYGLDLYGNVAIRPTGKNKDMEFAILFPFRLQNTTGIRHEEVNITGVTIANVASPTIMNYNTSKRSKQDVTFGAEGAFSAVFGSFKFTVGSGHVVHKDKRATSFAIDQAGISATAADYSRFTNPDQDALGRSNYGYLHARFRWIGVFYRDIYGTGSTGTLSALPSKPYLQQLLEADMTDTTPGNVSAAIHRGSAPGVDLGKARFRKQLGGIEFFPMPRLSIALGMSRQTASNPDGSRQKVSQFAQVAATGQTGIPPGTSMESQVNTILAAQVPFPNQYVATDLGGKLKEIRQYFLRASYEF